ncbi:YfhD family protein [Paenibacillus aquistagni]|uniref:YfhD family protein n=1 Tax=Paenibacillus aquistagni TaxID=1852522 RepID=UPI000B503794|nr:YfhD family protein [Paenibacillus aquistagni]NMM51534.1 YfhD family protein [Paenibacillus aquistagni]
MTTPNQDKFHSSQQTQFAEDKLPVTKSEDVEYSEELADAADHSAQARAKAADERAEQ